MIDLNIAKVNIVTLAFRSQPQKLILDNKPNNLEEKGKILYTVRYLLSNLRRPMKKEGQKR